MPHIKPDIIPSRLHDCTENLTRTFEALKLQAISIYSSLNATIPVASGVESGVTGEVEDVDCVVLAGKNKDEWIPIYSMVE